MRAWTETETALLERCVPATAAPPPLERAVAEPIAEAVRLALARLEARQPLDKQALEALPDALAALLRSVALNELDGVELALSAAETRCEVRLRDRCLRALLQHLEAGGPAAALTREQQRRLLALGRDDALPTWDRRLLCAFHGGGEDGLELLAELLARTKTSASADWLLAFQRRILAGRDLPHAPAALERLHTAAPWVHRRVLLGAIGAPEHAPFVPALVRMGRRTDPSTRLAIVEALVRIGSAAAEPFLIRVLGDSERPIARAATAGLTAFGTRAALEGLFDFTLHEQDAETARAAMVAIASIRRRHPAPEGTPEAGALTVAPGATDAGSLSLTGEPGAISLYRESEAALQGDSEPSKVSTTASEPEWHRLVPPPRRVPRMAWVGCLTTNEDGRTRRAAWIVLAVLMLMWYGTAPELLPRRLLFLDLFEGRRGTAWEFFLGIGTWSCLACVVYRIISARAQIRVLREGRPTYARMVERRTESTTVPVQHLFNNQPQQRPLYRYRFELLREDGKTYNFWRASARPDVPEYEDRSPRPLLYHGQDVLFFGAFQGVHVDRQGRLCVAWRELIWLAPALLAPAGVLAWLLRP
jgi:hypothetical protein